MASAAEALMYGRTGMTGHVHGTLVTGFVREHMPIVRGYSAQTCETYSHALRLLFSFAAEQQAYALLAANSNTLTQIWYSHFLPTLSVTGQFRLQLVMPALLPLGPFMRYVETRDPGAFEQVRAHSRYSSQTS